MRELDLQTRIIKDIRANGGYARKWASGFQVGVPDLIITHPDIGTVFAEIKLVKLSKIPDTETEIKIDITKKQQLELEDIRKAGGRSLILVGIETEMVGRLYCSNGSANSLIVSEGRLIDCEYWSRQKILFNTIRLIRGHYHGRGTIGNNIGRKL